MGRRRKTDSRLDTIGDVGANGLTDLLQHCEPGRSSGIESSFRGEPEDHTFSVFRNATPCTVRSQFCSRKEFFTPPAFAAAKIFGQSRLSWPTAMAGGRGPPGTGAGAVRSTPWRCIEMNRPG